MFRLLDSTRDDPSGPLISPGSAHGFWTSLRDRGPIEAEHAICLALAALAHADVPTLAQFDALVTLDRLSRGVVERLLKACVAQEGCPAADSTGHWQSALRLAESFGRAFDRFFAIAEAPGCDPGWRERTAVLAVHRLFHRQVELLLRVIRYEPVFPGQWRELHGAYRFAVARGAARQAVSIPSTVRLELPERRALRATTVEQQYLAILLLQVANTGQLAPREALCVRNWLAHWCVALALDPVGEELLPGSGDAGFVLDTHGTEGLVRPRHRSPATLRLDPAPLLVRIDAALASLRAAGSDEGSLTGVPRDREVTLLKRLRLAWASRPVHVARRGARTPLTRSAQAAFGLSSIVRMVGRDARKRRAAPAAAPGGEGDALDGFSATHTVAVLHQTWQIKDRSDSGCRLRGRITGDLGPGELIVFRDDETGAWTVAIVRRLKRIMHSHVEIGVEHIGRDPRRLVMVPSDDPDDLVAGAQASDRRFSGLCLPPSAAHPTMPFRTLLLTPREFAPGRAITILAGTNLRCRLRAIVEQHARFVWTSFDLLDPAAARCR